jgi:hypothetical protein
MERMQGKEVTVLLEQKEESQTESGGLNSTQYFVGLTDNYVRTAIPAADIPEGIGQGDLIKVRIDGYVKVRSANHSASGLDIILKGKI